LSAVCRRYLSSGAPQITEPHPRKVRLREAMRVGHNRGRMSDPGTPSELGTTTTRLREERKVVSALFADLVGSTTLAEALDAEDVRLVVGEAVARIVHAVEEFGGTVKDLAGDGVLAL